MENKTLLRSKTLVYTQPVAVRVQYQSIGSQVKFVDKENKILINIVAVMDQRINKQKRYKAKKNSASSYSPFYNKLGLFCPRIRLA